MARPKRISPRDARRAIERGDALLVCAYDDREKCEGLGVEGSVSFPELRERLGSLDKQRELIFFCA